ncbi:pectate lyase [Streptomyces geysiriensis]|uniref:pectate lyase n=1 Tax=Streptomyces geysiriensis TaxID=68207 RepID=UPI0027E146F3|nr:pectate lyase [Streptomyces geysiriensis]
MAGRRRGRRQLQGHLGLRRLQGVRRRRAERRRQGAPVQRRGQARRLEVPGGELRQAGALLRQLQDAVQAHHVIDDVDITAPGKSIVGVNQNYGDTAALRNIRVHGDAKKKIETCARYQGNSSGKEPKKLSPVGPYGKTCDFTASDITYK